MPRLRTPAEAIDTDPRTLRLHQWSFAKAGYSDAEKQDAELFFCRGAKSEEHGVKCSFAWRFRTQHSEGNSMEGILAHDAEKNLIAPEVLLKRTSCVYSELSSCLAIIARVRLANWMVLESVQ